MSGWGRKSGFCTFPPQGRELGAGGSSGGKKQLITNQDKNYFKKRWRRGWAPGGERKEISLCWADIAEEANWPKVFCLFFERHFFWQSEVCCSLFFGTPTQGDEDDLLFDSSFKTKKENAKSLYNSNSVLMKRLAFKFIRYDDNVIWWWSSSSPSSLMIMLYDIHHSSGMVLDSRGWASTKAGRLFLLIMYFF